MTEEHYLKKELYELLQRDPRIFEFLQAGSLDGVWYWDIEDPEHEWMSSRFWEVFGYDPAAKEHLAKEWQDMIHPDDLKLALSNFEKHCKDPTHPYDQLVRYRHKDGSTVWVRCRGVAVRNEEGKPIRMLGAHTDITKLKQMEERLAKTNQSLEAANRELQAFSYSVSHDLRAPLRAIEGYAKILEEDHAGRLDAEGVRVLKVITDETRTMTRLIEDLLEFSRTGRSDLRLAAVDMTQLAGSVLRDLLAQEPTRSVTQSISPLPHAQGDRALLRQVFANLIGNALKFTKGREVARIEIGGREEKQNHYWVKDNGAGFDMRYADKLFGVFQRLHTTKEFKGTGIGLALVERIIHRHGGRVWAEGKMDEGATFHFSLPREGGSHE